jgi:acidic leucine-rich nuclear phosphoprotein 32 family member B
LSKIAIAFPNIKAIAFGGNSIKTIAELKPLQALKGLTQLDLFNNPVSNSSEYRKQVFDLIPSLKVASV